MALASVQDYFVFDSISACIVVIHPLCACTGEVHCCAPIVLIVIEI